MTATATPEAPPKRNGEAPSLEVVTYALNGKEVNVGTPNGAGVYLAPPGTAGPTDTVTAWPVGWNILGYMSDAGPTFAQNTNKQDIIPWQSMVPIRSPVTSREITLQFIMWQLNSLTLALYFQTSQPTPIADGSFSMPVITTQAGKQWAVGVDTIDQGRAVRFIATKALVTANGNMPITRGAAVPLDTTLTCLDDNGTILTVLVGPPGP
jgi:hypothetical protein